MRILLSVLFLLPVLFLLRVLFLLPFVFLFLFVYQNGRRQQPVHHLVQPAVQLADHASNQLCPRLPMDGTGADGGRWAGGRYFGQKTEPKDEGRVGGAAVYRADGSNYLCQRV